MRDSHASWMTNTIRQEMEDECSDRDPDMDFGILHTSSLVIICQMVDENLQAPATISPELMQEVLLLGIEQVIIYEQMYRADIQEIQGQLLQGEI